MPSRLGLQQRLYAAPQSRLPISRFLVVTRKTSKFDPMLLELVPILEWLALALANSASIYGALSMVSDRATGKVANALRIAVRKVHFGQSLDSALVEMQNELKSPLIDEFVNRVLMALNRGTPIAAQLRNLASSARSQFAIGLLARAAANELKMLVPLVFLILPVTIWFAIFPSLQYLQLGF